MMPNASAPRIVCVPPFTGTMPSSRPPAVDHVVETAAPPWGKISHHGLPGIPSLSQADAARPAPWIGVNNDQVFGEILGLSAARIEELKQREAIK